jgi:hypothetical protein
LQGSGDDIPALDSKVETADTGFFDGRTFDPENVEAYLRELAR